MTIEEKKFPVRLKYANIKNLDKISEIESRCFPKEEAASAKQIQKRIESYPNFFICAWYLGEIVGFINGPVSESRDLTDDMYEDANAHNPVLGRHQIVLSLAVDPDYQHQGIAGLLLDELSAKSKKQGHMDIVLTCKKKLVDFYKKHGFEDEGISSSSHGGVVWHQMRKTL